MTPLLMWLRGLPWARRLRCHHSIVCCQYTDLPTCNSELETHRRGRAKWRRLHADLSHLDTHHPDGS